MTNLDSMIFFYHNMVLIFFFMSLMKILASHDRLLLVIRLCLL